MLNRYPLWKNLLILLVIALGIIYALPNLYPEDPSVQITGTRGSIALGEEQERTVEQALQAAGLGAKAMSLAQSTLLLRFNNADEQLLARDVLQAALGNNYVIALNQAATTPAWLRAIGAQAINLGLDLRGGVHFQMQVDMQAAVNQRLEATASEIRASLRSERLRFRQVGVEEGQIQIQLAAGVSLDEVQRLLQSNLNDYQYQQTPEQRLLLSLSEQERRKVEDYAVEQNLITLRNRVNELGVAEPLVQRSGRDRIVVELPGVQDTAAAKRILGATANLEFRLEARRNADSFDIEEFEFRDQPERRAFLERDIITTGNSVANASIGFDESNRPQVNIRLNGQGGRLMSQATRPNVGRAMGVLFIEHKTRTHFEQRDDGERLEVRKPYIERGIISLATIQSELGQSFRITGIGNTQEAAELALLLRAGALAAPIYFVEERTIGPSLGAANIERGVMSIYIGLALVIVFMLAWYRTFGVFACVALTANLILLIALLSVLGATLTLPGIAGIVLTLGMAVDANVLINARIKEELYHRGLSPQNAIHSGYEKAFSTIMDANITTLLVAIILFSIGTGPVKGFAVTLSLGLLTSMFTAIMVTRMQVNWVYGKRRIERLPL